MIELGRRSLVFGGSSTVAALGLSSVIGISPALAGPGGVRRTFGGGGGNPFASQYPRSMGLSTAGEVDALILNESWLGGRGGGNPSSIVLGDKEYWSDVTVRWGGRIDYLSLTTNKGRSVSGGNPNGGDNAVRLSGIRLLSVAGRSDQRLDAIELGYIPGFRPSQLVEAQKQVILDIASGPQTIEVYTDKSARNAQSYELITERMSQFTASASAEAELFSKFSVSTGLKLENSSKETIQQSSENTLKTGTKVTRTIDDNHVAFLTARVNIMREQGGDYWMEPVGEANWVPLAKTEFAQITDCYDLTGGAAIAINRRPEPRYGFLWYK